jgi:hypothetical protein
MSFTIQFRILSSHFLSKDVNIKTYQWVPGALSLGVKRPGREADHSPPSSTEVNNAWSYTSTPKYALKAWCSVKKRRDKFTFLPLTFTCFVCVRMLVSRVKNEDWDSLRTGRCENIRTWEGEIKRRLMRTVSWRASHVYCLQNIVRAFKASPELLSAS